MITHVDISHNEISDNGGVALAKAVGMRNHPLTLERPAICPYLERPQWVIFDPSTKVH